MAEHGKGTGINDSTVTIYKMYGLYIKQKQIV